MKYVDVDPIIEELSKDLDEFAKRENKGALTDSYVQGARRVLLVFKLAKGVEIEKEDK